MYPIITTVTLITKSWSRRRLLAPVGPAPVRAGIDSVLFITQWRQRSPVLRRAAPDEVELPSRVTGYTATADATKHVGYQHNNESSVVYRDSTWFLQPGSVARLRDTRLPTRTRSRWHRRSGRRWHTRTVARRLGDPQLAWPSAAPVRLQARSSVPCGPGARMACLGPPTARSRQAVCRGPLIRLPDAATGVQRLRDASARRSSRPMLCASVCMMVAPVDDGLVSGAGQLCCQWQRGASSAQDYVDGSGQQLQVWLAGRVLDHWL